MVALDELLDTIIRERTSDVRELLNMENLKISKKKSIKNYRAVK